MLRKRVRECSCFLLPRARIYVCVCVLDYTGCPKVGASKHVLSAFLRAADVVNSSRICQDAFLTDAIGNCGAHISFFCVFELFVIFL